MNMNIEGVIYGSNRRTSLRYLLVAGGLFVATITVLPIASNLEVPIPILDGSYPTITIFIVFSLATVQSYQNSGLPICIALTTVVPLGFFMILSFSSTAVPSVSIVWGIGSALFFGVPLGTLGFLTGAGLRRLTKA